MKEQEAHNLLSFSFAVTTPKLIYHVVVVDFSFLRQFNRIVGQFSRVTQAQQHFD